MKKFLNSDWIRKMQFSFNKMQKRSNSMQKVTTKQSVSFAQWINKIADSYMYWFSVWSRLNWLEFPSKSFQSPWTWSQRKIISLWDKSYHERKILNVKQNHRQINPWQKEIPTKWKVILWNFILQKINVTLEKRCCFKTSWNNASQHLQMLHNSCFTLGKQISNIIY